MQYAKNPATFVQMHFANGENLRYNVDILKEILMLRDEKARLLGYASLTVFRLRCQVHKEARTCLGEPEKVVVPQGRKRCRHCFPK
jgi:Zn-dependent oligopeptidase